MTSKTYRLVGRDEAVPDYIIKKVYELGFDEFMAYGSYTAVFTNSNRDMVCIITGEDEDKAKLVMSQVSGFNKHLPKTHRVDFDHDEYGIYIMKWYDTANKLPKYLNNLDGLSVRDMETWHDKKGKLPKQIDAALTEFVRVALEQSSKITFDIAERNFGMENGTIILRDPAVVFPKYE